MGMMALVVIRPQEDRMHQKVTQEVATISQHPKLVEKVLLFQNLI